MRYLMRAGYRVIPVNPNRAGETLHGEKVVASLDEAGPVDLVNVFRRSDAMGAIVDDVIRTGAPALWTQLGIQAEEAAARARSAGVRVVTNRCISVEHSRLSG